MDIPKIKAALALGLGFSGALSVGNASANIPDVQKETQNIVALSTPDLRVTVYDGIATNYGNTGSDQAAQHRVEQIAEVEGIEFVINMITSDNSAQDDFV